MHTALLEILKQLTLWCHVASVTPTTTLVTYQLSQWCHVASVTPTTTLVTYQLSQWCHVASVTPTTTLVTYPAVHKLCNSLLLCFISITKLGCQMLRLIPLLRTSIAFEIWATIPTFSDQHSGSTRFIHDDLLSVHVPQEKIPWNFIWN